MTLRWKIREKEIHKIEVHVAGICFREGENGKFDILVGKRNPHRKLFPNKWECGGGQVHVNESFEDAIKFHMKEELNIDVDIVCPVLTYRISTDGNTIPGIRIICKMKDASQQPIPNPDEFTECKWISETEIDKYDFIPGLSAHLKKAIESYKKLVS
jgi:isopentenyldiphosphate isomerase